MRLHLGVFLLSFCLLLACNEPKTKDQSPSTATQQPKDKAEPASTDLTKYGIANHEENVLGGLMVGDRAPDFEMMDQDGNEINLEKTLTEGPVLLVFLRAEWCSFCVRHLKAFQDNIQAIHEAGDIRVLAVSPQQKSYMQEFHQTNGFSFPILHDSDHQVMKDYKVFFHVTDKYNDYIEQAKGSRIEVFNGDTEAVMPIPATYLIGQDKTIKYVHYDPNYKKRSDVKEVLALF